MHRFSIRTLIGFVFVSAIGLASLRNANGWTAGTMLSIALIASGTGILGAIFLRSCERAVVDRLRSVQWRLSHVDVFSRA